MRKLRTLLIVLTAVLCAAIAGAAAEAAPEGYPAIVEGLDFGGATVHIYDWWSSGGREATPTDMQQLQYDYWDWLEETYHVHVVQESLSDWDKMTNALAEMVANGDSSDLCIVAVDGNFAGSVIQNRLFMSWTEGLDAGNTATQDLVTVNGTCYGTSWGAAAEPRQSVFFNKDVLTAAGISWQDIYTAQKNGTWTWAKMEEIMSAVQRDTDGDGQTDIWGLTGNGDDIIVGLMISNGAEFYDFDEDGKLAPAIDSEEMRAALTERRAWNAYLAPVTGWDSYKQTWSEGKAAFMIGQSYEGFNRNNNNMGGVENWGYVAMPMGPRMDHYVTTVTNNVYGVPNLYDEATSRKLQQLFRLWSWDAPGTEDAWKTNISGITEDEEAIATYGMLREPECATVMKNILLGGSEAAQEILWRFNDYDDVDDLISNALPVFQSRCDDFNTPEQIEWALSDEGVLTISGTGRMKTHPWSGRAGEITEVIIEEGVTTVCEGAFAYCANLKTVRLPYSLIDIGEGAFPASCSSLTDIYYNGLEIDWDGGVLAWGYSENDAAYNAHMHYRETEPAGEDYPVTVTGIRCASDGETLTAGDDGYYTAGNNDTGLFSFSAPAMEGYDLSYRFLNISWWDTPEKTAAGVTDYETRLTTWYSDDVLYTAMAVYVPADPAEPILLATQDIRFHITGEEPGLIVSAPGAAEPGAGYTLTVTVPETMNPAGAEWYFEGYKYAEDGEEEEFCFMLSSYNDGDLTAGVNRLTVPDGWLLGPGRYIANFGFEGIGYRHFGFNVDFAVIDGWLPDDLEIIGDEAFAGADFRAVWVPDGCTRICSGAFANCENLEFISLPAGTGVEEGAWAGNVFVHTR